MMNYELYEKVKCPKCQKEFTCIEDLSTEIDMEKIKIFYSGYCEDCETYTYWDMTYKIDNISPLKIEEKN